MPTFTDALLQATYKGGKPGRLTEAHRKAEHHRFKTERLFKNTAIPKDLYVSRLIQHYVIIKALEQQLQCLNPEAKHSLNAFFTLQYLSELWRTPAIVRDLQKLGVNAQEIVPSQIAKATLAYTARFKTMPPKALLAHYLTHIVGFMHGGNIIQSKYIDPSNRLTQHQIPSEQYDFSSVYPFLHAYDKPNSFTVFRHMMIEVDKNELEEGEDFSTILSECESVYTAMSAIYDDLCDMHTLQPRFSTAKLVGLGVGLSVLAYLFMYLKNACEQLGVSDTFQAFNATR